MCWQFILCARNSNKRAVKVIGNRMLFAEFHISIKWNRISICILISIHSVENRLKYVQLFFCSWNAVKKSLTYYTSYMNRFIKEGKNWISFSLSLSFDSVRIPLFVFYYFSLHSRTSEASVTHLSWLSVCRFILYVNSMKEERIWLMLLSLIDKWMRNEYNMGIKRVTRWMWLFLPFLPSFIRWSN